MISADPDGAAKFHLDALPLYLHGVDAQDPLAMRIVGWRGRDVPGNVLRTGFRPISGRLLSTGRRAL
jgi:hypothetical protein